MNTKGQVDRQIDEWIDKQRRMDGGTDGGTEGGTDGRMDGCMDGQVNGEKEEPSENILDPRLFSSVMVHREQTWRLDISSSGVKINNALWFIRGKFCFN